MPDADPIAADQAARRFSATQASELRAFLDAQERDTVVYPLDAPQQVLLGDGFRTAEGGSRLSWLALQQCCRALAAGLSTVVGDLAGRRRCRESDDPADYSTPDAAAVYNAVVRRRFGTRLCGYMAVRDDRAGVVDAVVGRGYRRLPNVDFLDMVTDAVSRSGRGHSLRDAVLVGRRLSVRFVEAACLDLGDYADDRRFAPARAGYSFANSEIGDGAVRATPLVFFSASGAAALPYNGSSRVSHTGKDFHRRLAGLIETASERAAREPSFGRDLSGRLGALAAVGLGLSGATSDEDADDDRLVRLRRALAAAGMPPAAARRAARRAALGAGSPPDPSDPAHGRRSAWPARSVLDVLAACLAESAAYPLAVHASEAVEQVCYKLLTGRLLLTG